MYPASIILFKCSIIPIFGIQLICYIYARVFKYEMTLSALADFFEHFVPATIGCRRLLLFYCLSFTYHDLFGLISVHLF